MIYFVCHDLFVRHCESLTNVPPLFTSDLASTPEGKKCLTSLCSIPHWPGFVAGRFCKSHRGINEMRQRHDKYLWYVTAWDESWLDNLVLSLVVKLFTLQQSFQPMLK